MHVDETMTRDGMTWRTETFGIKSASWNGKAKDVVWEEMMDAVVPAAGEFAPAIP